jgi:cyclic-di-AMP phosphodiesterase PgpH
MLGRWFRRPSRDPAAAGGSRVVFHGVRWGLLMIAAVATRLVFPFPALGTGGELLGPILYNALVLSAFWSLLLVYRQESYTDFRQVSFLAALFVMVAVVASAAMRLFPGRYELLPIPLAAMLLTMLYNGRLAMIAAVVLAMLFAGQYGLREPYAVFPGLLGGIAAALSIRTVRERNQLFPAIGYIWGSYALSTTTLGLVLGTGVSPMLQSTLVGGVTSLLSASVALLLVPPAERWTGITTDLTLLELSDLGRPLLHRLALEAPGTFAHSILVANLSEAACDAIGANGLLGRVGCYYHDVGKLHAPGFFVENQGQAPNPHDSMTPEESALVLREHVTAGIALADEAGLPDALRRFIPEHHGTMPMHFFLERARRSGAAFRLENFLYPGPRPRSPETAVAMLADSAEAAVRVLENPSPERVRAALDRVVAQRMSEGQLEEAPLTMRDFERIKDVFARMLGAAHHVRPAYPSPAAGFPAEGTRARGT